MNLKYVMLIFVSFFAHSLNAPPLVTIGQLPGSSSQPSSASEALSVINSTAGAISSVANLVEHANDPSSDEKVNVMTNSVIALVANVANIVAHMIKHRGIDKIESMTTADVEQYLLDMDPDYKVHLDAIVRTHLLRS